MNERSPIKSFADLEVYQNSYKGSIEVITKIVPKLPKEEQYDLRIRCADQRRLFPG